MRTLVLVVSVTFLGLEAHAQNPAEAKPPAAAKPSEPPASEIDPLGASVVELLREEAAGVLRTVSCDAVKRWVLATNWLNVPDTRRVYSDRAAGKACKQEQWEKLPPQERASYKALDLDERFYYYTRYGSPLAYARALDLACDAMGCKACFAGKRILDFGYGGIGHLRLLASIGAEVTGVEVDPVLRELYSWPGDTGKVLGVGMSDQKAPDGSLTLVHGRWPADEAVKAQVGGGFDLIMSKNTLKRGYIHPAKEVDKRMLVDLGVDDKTFLGAVAASLNTGGLFMIYNICPKQSEDKYIPWADGQSPFSRELFEQSGFEVLEFDKDDTAATRTLGKALGWDRGEGAMDLADGTFAWVTLVRKK